MDAEYRMAALFAELNEELSGNPNELTFQRVVDRALEVVPGCDHCGLHLRIRRGKAESATSTDEIAAEADELQDGLGEGPCLDAAFQEENFVIHDLTKETRWPVWAARATDLGLRSSMSVRLTANDTTIGALNFYSDRPGTFDGDQDIALIFASHAAAAMANARLVGGLRTALDSRHAIGIAQGVLAVRYDISYERAFQVLHRYSNDHNVKLRDVADQVLETRSLPGADG
jgi:GAF domain-containing protein